jgi:IclR family transcriptional regulator, acetate operon repressor
MRSIGSLTKGLRILEYVAAAEDGVRVSEIARALGLPSSNLTLFLNSLLETGYVLKNPVDNRYYVTEKLHHVAVSGGPNQYALLVHASRPALEELRDRFDENVMVTVLSLFKLKVVTRLQSKRNVQIVNDDETMYTPHVTAGGKAILAHLSRERLDAYFRHTAMERFTVRSLASREDVEKELEQTRARGYAVNRGEYQAEVLAVAAPIFHAGAPLGALVLQFPIYRHREDELESSADAVVAAAARIGGAIVGGGAAVAATGSPSAGRAR